MRFIELTEYRHGGIVRNITFDASRIYKMTPQTDEQVMDDYKTLIDLDILKRSSDTSSGYRPQIMVKETVKEIRVKIGEVERKDKIHVRQDPSHMYKLFVALIEDTNRIISEAKAGQL